MESSSRRDVLRLGLGVGAANGLSVLGSGCGADPAAHQRPPGGRLENLSIPTDVGTFSALAAGSPKGRKVLLLHGFSEFGSEWSAQLRSLQATGCRAVAPDQRGYSAGVRPEAVDAYQLDQPVQDVVRMADALGWDRFDLVGHDWGSCVAWLAASRFADRVRSLTAVSVPHPAAFAEALRDDPAQQHASAYMAGFRQPAPGPENRLKQAGRIDLPGVPRRKQADYYRRLMEPGAATGALNWYRANDFTGYDDATVAAPTLFVSATDDPLVAESGVAASERWETGRYRHVALDRVGHFVPETAPARVSRLLREHLAAT